MRKINFKRLTMSFMLLLFGVSSFGQTTTDSVWVLAGNNVQFAATLSSGDSAIWTIQDLSSGTIPTATVLTTATAGVAFAGTLNSTLKITGSNFTQFQQPADSLTSNQYRIGLVIFSPGGCYSGDTSFYYVRVLPYLHSMAATWVDEGPICASNVVTDSLQATKPALILNGLAGHLQSVSINDITWWKDGTQIANVSGVTEIIPNNGTTPGTSILQFQTPDNTTAVAYSAQAAYDLGSNSLIVSTTAPIPGNTDGHATSNTISIQATAQPTAPTISGSTVSGF